MLVTLLAPWVHPASYERLCSAAGHRYVQVDDHGIAMQGDDAQAAHCPMCLPTGAPPSTIAFAPDAIAPVATPTMRMHDAHIAALVGAPFPPRAPPAVS